MPVVINEIEETVETPAAAPTQQQDGAADPALIPEQVEKAMELQRERRQRLRAY